MIPIVSDIKRFSVHDGDGIRSTVFFKGCSLKCLWCHNPECIDFKPQLAYFANNCINCGECVKSCKNNAHSFIENSHKFNKDLCVLCGKCAKVCLGGALKIYNKQYSVDDLCNILLSDKRFYDSSGGGVTLSGGECLIFDEYCANLMKKLKEHDIHIAVDTCGNVNRSAFDKTRPYTDLFLYDIKAIDENTHIKCTGHSNKLILDNLKYIDSFNIPIYIRIPYVPGFNSGEVEKISEFIKPFKNITKVDVLPYHNYAAYKYKALGIKNTLPEKLPGDDEIKEAQNLFNG